MKNTILILISSALVSNAASSLIEYSGGVYNQDFNTLQSSAVYTPFTDLPAGWQVSHDSYVWTNGTAGYSNNYGTYAFSSSTASSDKALGMVIGSTGQAFFGAHLQNTTGGVLTSFTLSYYAEQWAAGAVNASNQSIPFKYSLGGSSFVSDNYTSVPSLAMNSIQDGNGTFTALDGNLAQNRTLVSYTVTGINWKPGQNLWLRWDGVSVRFSSSRALAVDDLSFSAIPEPSAPVLTIFGLIVAAGFFRSRRS